MPKPKFIFFTHPYLYEQMICPPESLRYILSIVLSADNLYQTKKHWIKIGIYKKIKISFWRFFPFLTCKSFPLSVITFIISLSEAQKRQIIWAEFHLMELISFPFGWRIEKFGRFPEIRFSLLVTHIRPVDGARDIKSPFCSISPISHRSFLLSLFFSLCLLKR